MPHNTSAGRPEPLITVPRRIAWRARTQAATSGCVARTTADECRVRDRGEDGGEDGV